MKAIMYHYVRPDAAGMPYFRYLALDDFCRQLDLFEERHGFVSPEEFSAAVTSGETNSNGVVLTFDDGFRDHYDFVVPELKRRGLWGFFYIPTLIYQTGKLLDVHRTHILLGTHGGAAVLEVLQNLVRDDMLAHEGVAEFRTGTYVNQTNDDATQTVKRILNYFIADDYRTSVLDQLMTEFFAGRDQTVADFYITPPEIREMQDDGMIIGSHSASHRLLSTLDDAAQRVELEDSFGDLDDLIGGLSMRTFCYPYGGFHSFNATTERLLDELDCRFAFNVEARDIDTNDLTNRRQALPRYNCNMFDFGKARLG